MQNWYNIVHVFLIHHPEVWMTILVAFAAALTMRGDIFAIAGRYCIGIAAVLGAGYMMMNGFHF